MTPPSSRVKRTKYHSPSFLSASRTVPPGCCWRMRRPSFVLGPVLDLEVGGLFRGQGLDEEVGGLEVGQDGDREIDGQAPQLVGRVELDPFGRVGGGDDEIDLAAGAVVAELGTLLSGALRQ